MESPLIHVAAEMSCKRWRFAVRNRLSSPRKFFCVGGRQSPKQAWPTANLSLGLIRFLAAGEVLPRPVYITSRTINSRDRAPRVLESVVAITHRVSLRSTLCYFLATRTGGSAPIAAQAAIPVGTNLLARSRRGREICITSR